MEYRLVEASEMEEAIQLADLVFRTHDPEKKSFAKSHPQAFSSALKQSFGAFKNGQLVSFIGLVPSIIRIGAAQLQCYSLGGVCTHPDHRGEGYAGQLMERAIRHVDASDGSLLLISGKRSLYSRTGCFPYGAVKECTPRASSLADIALKIGRTKPFFIRECQPTDWFRNRAVYLTKPVGFERSLWDLALLLEAEPTGTISKLHHKVLVAEQKDGSLLAFIVVGVPYSDTSAPPVVIEWAGDASAVISLMMSAFEQYALAEVTMRIPWQEQELIRILAAGVPFTSNNGTIRIMDVRRLMEQLQPYLLSVDPDLAAELEVGMSPDGTALMRIGDAAVQLDRMALTSLVFDIDPRYDAEPAIRNRLNKVFPIPFPYTRGLNFV